MVVGFNHNFRYKGELFHVQTEDSGLKSPHIITLLYRGGTILASKKTSYADITKVDRLEQVVEELMKEQHREMLRRLKSGEFDEVIAGRRSVAQLAAQSIAQVATSPPVTSEPVVPVSPSPRPVAPAPPAAPVVVKKTEVTPAPAPGAHSEKRPDARLDEIILSYLLGEGEDVKKS